MMAHRSNEQSFRLGHSDHVSQATTVHDVTSSSQLGTVHSTDTNGMGSEKISPCRPGFHFKLSL